jgi:hypothetical protein
MRFITQLRLQHQVEPCQSVSLLPVLALRNVCKQLACTHRIALLMNLYSRKVLWIAPQQRQS